MPGAQASQAAKIAAKQSLLAATRRATESLPKFSAWLLAGLGAAFFLLLANLDKATQFIDIQYIRFALLLFLLSLVIAVLTTYLTMMVKAALGAQDDGEVLAKAISDAGARVDSDVFVTEFLRGLLPPFRWLASSSIRKAKAGDIVAGARLAAKLSQTHSLLVVVQSIVALVAVGALAFGLKLQ